MSNLRLSGTFLLTDHSQRRENSTVSQCDIISFCQTTSHPDPQQTSSPGISKYYYYSDPKEWGEVGSGCFAHIFLKKTGVLNTTNARPKSLGPPTHNTAVFRRVVGRVFTRRFTRRSLGLWCKVWELEAAVYCLLNFANLGAVQKRQDATDPESPTAIKFYEMSQMSATCTSYFTLASISWSLSIRCMDSVRVPGSKLRKNSSLSNEHKFEIPDHFWGISDYLFGDRFLPNRREKKILFSFS